MPVGVGDFVMLAVTTIAAIALSPVFSDMTDRVIGTADPLSMLMLDLIIPFIFLALVVGIGVSARQS